MNGLVLHPATLSSFDQFIGRTAHAVLIVGPAGCGKSSLSRHLAAGLLSLEHNVLEKYPYIRVITPVDGKAIPIDSIRELQHFMTLRIPGKDDTKHVARIAIIEDAHLLTTEAQNALLKTLEEPPLDTVLILTATSPESLLATIQSRVRMMHVVPPAVEALKAHFLEQKFTAQDIDRALMLTGGLPGLTHALLADSETHPLYEATVQARGLLQAKAYDRLVLVDSLGKQKQLAIDICFILGQMSRMALVRLPDVASPAAKRWQNIMKQSYVASEQLRGNTQAKLVLTNLMLEL